MVIRMLMLGVLLGGVAGQLACSETAEAAQGGAPSQDEAAKKPPGGQFCGGIAAIQCPEGLVCVDDPTDSCDPQQGGADCGGICVHPDAQSRPECNYGDPCMSYVSQDPNECTALLFQCPEGSTAFFNECGCGCKHTQKACDYQDPKRRYVSQDPAQCAAIRFVCEPGESAFFDECGCGCEPTPAP